MRIIKSNESRAGCNAVPCRFIRLWPRLAVARALISFGAIGLLSFSFASQASGQTIHASVTAETFFGQSSATGLSFAEIARADVSSPDGTSASMAEVSSGFLASGNLLQLMASASARGSDIARAFSFWEDSLTIGSSAALLPSALTFVIDLNGGIATDPHVSGDPARVGGTPAVLARLTLSAAGTGGFWAAQSAWYDRLPQGRYETQPGIFTDEIRSNNTSNATFSGLAFESPTAHFGTVAFTVPVTSNTVPIQWVLENTAGASRGFADVNFTATVFAILLPDGSTPESQGMVLTFDSGLTSPNLVVNAVPEPASLVLLATGAIGALFCRRVQV